MSNKSRTSSDLLDTAERRAFVLRMRKAGATYREIADAALNRFGADALPGGWSDRYAHKDVKRELDKLRDEIGEEAEAVRTLELQRLDDLLKGLWPLAARKNPDLKALDRVLRLMKRRAELLGLDAPSKQEITGADGGAMVVQIVRREED